MSAKREPETFEELYQRLEALVAKLEEGGLPLDDAINLYEEGMTLARQCQEMLDAAELKVTRLRDSLAAVPPESVREEEEVYDES